MGLKKKPPLSFENSHLKIMNTVHYIFKIKQKTGPATEFLKGTTRQAATPGHSQIGILHI